ncbi:MAG: T9SS type A sorting domain-containing protein [Flavobacteriia bacterium]|nr:T9SS type A sorting domain-containing protein [Flavobacteriia bacterium]
MKFLKKYMVLVSLTIITSTVFGQRENENWTFGFNQWKFNHVSGNLTTSTFSNPSSPFARFQGSATISDSETGQLLFFTDGFKIYNKNHLMMENGDKMYNHSSSDYGIMISGILEGNGLTTIQPTIIVPYPGDSNKYYVFFNGNYEQKTWYTLLGSGQEYTTNGNMIINMGLRVGIVDLTFNGGLGKLIIPNLGNENLLLEDVLNGLTSVKHSDDQSFWVIVQKKERGQYFFYSYKITSSGLQTNPVISPAEGPSTVLKVSPDGQYLFSGNSELNNGNILYNFDNQSGLVSSPNKFTETAPIDFYTGVNTSYAEFSSNSNIIYLIIGRECLCIYPSPKYDFIGLAQYNIQTGELIGRDEYGQTDFPLDDTASLQLAANEKIYLTFSHPFAENYQSQNLIKITKIWATIDFPNVWNPSVNPISNYYNFPFNDERYMSLTFPQLIPQSAECLENLIITSPISSNQDFQVSNKITASSQINSNVTVSFKANEIELIPNFSVNAFQNSNFTATINPCVSNLLIRKNKVKNTAITDQKDSLYYPILYPNPVSNYLNVYRFEQILEWELVDIYGNTKNIKFHSEQNKIVVNISNLTSGIYYFNAVMKNGNKFQKSIIKR